MGTSALCWRLGVAKVVANPIYQDNTTLRSPVPSEVLVIVHNGERSPWVHGNECRFITTTELAMSCPPDGGAMALASSVRDGSFLHLAELSPDPEHWGWASSSQNSEGLATKSHTTTHTVHCTISLFIQLQNPPPFPPKLRSFTSATFKRNETTC